MGTHLRWGVDLWAKEKHNFKCRVVCSVVWGELWFGAFRVFCSSQGVVADGPLLSFQQGQLQSQEACPYVRRLDPQFLWVLRTPLKMQRAGRGGVHLNVYPLTWALAISSPMTGSLHNRIVRVTPSLEGEVGWAAERVEGHSRETQREMLRWAALLEDFMWIPAPRTTLGSHGFGTENLSLPLRSHPLLMNL